MTARVRTSVIFIAGAACVVALGVAIAAFAFRETLQRTLFLRQAQRATGLVIEADRVTGGGAAYVLGGVRARTQGGAVVVSAAHARVDVHDSLLSLDLERPQIVIALDRLRGDEMERTNAALAAWHGAAGSERVTLGRGTLLVAGGEIPVPLLRCEDVAGALRARGSHVAYDVVANLVDGPARYAVESHTLAQPDGSERQRWSADVLPLAPFETLVPAPAEVRTLAGWLHDVTFETGAAQRAHARLDDVGVTLGAHRFDEMHGEVRLEGDGLGSARIDGRIDVTVPFEASGEVHDVAPNLAWLRAGSNDLRALGRLATSIASEPHVRALRVEATAPGLAFAQYALATEHGPLAVSVLSADPAEPTLRMDTVIAEDRVVSGGERTSAMGVRTHAVGGVNGDYFDIGQTYQPQGMLVRSGRIVRGPTDRAALVIDRAKHVRFGEYHLRGVVTTSRGAMPVTLFNDWPPGQVAVITPDFGKELRPSTKATFVALEPVAGTPQRFRVAAIAPPGSAPQPRFGIAIGELVHVPLPRIGENVSLSYDVDPPLGDAIAAIGGGPILLRDGNWYEDPHAPAPDERLYRWPVLALARETDDRLLLVAVDGRHPERSVGATRPEFAALLQRLGAVDAMALDSGGSVTLVSRAPGARNVSVRNVPSDNSAERWISDGLFFYSSAPEPQIVPAVRAPTPVPEMRPAP